MQQIDRAGTFRGFIVEHGVSETNKGYPQFVGEFKAVEFYDETGELTGGEPGYIDWAPYDQGTTLYLVLYTKGADGQWVELKNAEQVKKALAWDGLSFESLANGDYHEKMIVVRMKEEEYQGRVRIKGDWIDAADANPVKTLPKFDAAKLAGLTAKIGGILAAKATAPTPAKAPVPATAKPAGAPTAPPRGKPGPKPKAKPALPTAPAPTPAVPASAAPSGSPPPTPTTPPPAPATPTTKLSAWEKVNKLSGCEGDAAKEAKVAEVWIEEVMKLGKTEDKMTSDDWHTVQEAVLARVSAI